MKSENPESASLSRAISKSARGLAQSRTLTRFSKRLEVPPGRGVRQPSGAFARTRKMFNLEFIPRAAAA